MGDQLGTSSFSCPVSLERFQREGPNTPRLLPCGHSVSEAALHAIFQKRGQHNCPLCRATLQAPLVGIDSFPVNHELLNFIKASRGGFTASLGTDLSEQLHAAGSAPEHSLPSAPQHATYASKHAHVPDTAVAPSSGLHLKAEVDDSISASEQRPHSRSQLYTQAPQQPTISSAPVSAKELLERLTIPSAIEVPHTLWHRLAEEYQLHTGNFQGPDETWRELNSTSDGSPVTLTQDSSHTPVAAFKASQRACLAHVALHLLPDASKLAATFLGLVRPPGTLPLPRELHVAYEAPGCTLREYLAALPRRQMAVEEAVSMSAQMAECIAAMHQHKLPTRALAALNLDTIRRVLPPPVAASRDEPKPQYLFAPFRGYLPQAGHRSHPAQQLYSPAVTSGSASLSLQRQSFGSDARDLACVPPEEVAVGTVGVLQGRGDRGALASPQSVIEEQCKGDVWRLAAVLVVALSGDDFSTQAAPGISPKERHAVAMNMALWRMKRGVVAQHLPNNVPDVLRKALITSSAARCSSKELLQGLKAADTRAEDSKKEEKRAEALRLGALGPHAARIQQTMGPSTQDALKCTPRRVALCVLLLLVFIAVPAILVFAL